MGGAPAPRHRSAADAVQATITDSALAGERVVAVARLVFCLAVGIRSAWMWGTTSFAAGHETERALIVFPALAAAILLSAGTLRGFGRARPRRLLHLSVALDAVVGFVALLPNVLWPAPGYQGMPFMSDLAAVLLLTMAAGLRHSASAAALGGVLNGVGYLALVAVDQAVSGDTLPIHAAHYSLFGILLAGAAAIALIIAVRTRRLVERAAHAAVTAAQAHQGLRTLLREHHDLRTVMTSAQLNADLLARRLDEGAPAGRGAVAHLRDDLGELRAQLDQVKERTLAELVGLEPPRPAPLGDAIAAVIATLEPRFPAVAIAAAPGDAPPVLVAGGEAILRRILANLLVNACEGDGARGPRRVEVHARPEGGRVAIEIVDDGPGLPAHVLAVRPGEALSTKPAGNGLGLGLVDGLVRASGGSVTWSNPGAGGARVRVELAAAG
jgi:signal transduction histidine kinase